jgi:hypothetical protein
MKRMRDIKRNKRVKREGEVGKISQALVAHIYSSCYVGIRDQED